MGSPRLIQGDPLSLSALHREQQSWVRVCSVCPVPHWRVSNRVKVSPDAVGGSAFPRSRGILDLHSLLLLGPCPMLYNKNGHYWRLHRSEGLFSL